MENGPRGLRTALPFVLAAAFLLAAGAATGNVQVNQDPPGLDQHTTSIVLHPPLQPGAPDLLIVGYDEDPFNFNGVGTSWSPDYGLTWFDSATPMAPVWPNNLDASVASDRAGFVYACMSSFDFWPPNNLNSGIYVAASGDGAQNFGAPVAVSLMAGPAGALPWETKPKVEADGYMAAGSPYAGNVYVVWERDLPATGWINGPSDACFSRSLDQGATWSPPLPINDNAAGDLVLWPDLDVGADGSVTAAWTDSPYWMQHQGTLVVDRSVDGGVTFGPDVRALSFWAIPQTLTDLTGPPGQPTTFALSYPSVAVDPGNPNRIGVAFAADPDNGPAGEARVDVGDMPSSFDLSLLPPTSGASNLAYGGAYLHAAWSDSRGLPPDVFYNRMPLSSVTAPVWSGPETILSTQPAMDHHGANNVNLVSSGTHVYVTWDEWAGVDYTHLIWFNGSQDEGATWLPQALALDSHGRVCREPIVTSAAQGHVCVVWLEDQLNGSTDLYANVSTDGGVNWLAGEVRLPNVNRVMSHDVASVFSMNSDVIYVVWAEETPDGAGSLIYASVSYNGGLAWQSPLRLDNAPAGSQLAFWPKICCQGSEVYAAWVDSRTGIEDIHFNWAINYTMSGWNLDTRIDAGAARDFYPQIACGQGNVYVVYESDRNNPGGNDDIYINYSIFGGAVWQGERRVDTGAPLGASHSVYPRLCVGGPDGQPAVYVTWMDDRNGPAPFSGWDIYANHSNDGGATWPTPDYRVDVGDQPGLNDSWYPHIDGPVACYLYRDERNGTGDLYGNLLMFGPDEGDILYTESTDGGATWLNPPLRVNDDPGASDQSHPWCDIKPDGTVDVVWYDRRNDPQDRNIETFFAALPPGATAFQPNVPVSNQIIAAPPGAFWIGDYIGVAVDTATAHVAWADNRREQNLFDAWYAGQPNPQNPLHGACCQPAGAYCLQTTQALCQQMGGNFMGLGVPCTQGLCDPTGFRDGDGGPLPDGRICAIRPNVPNPFNPATVLHYYLADDVPVRLAIHDAAGRLVRVLVDLPLQQEGAHEARWDGRDAAGRAAAAGVYFCRLEAGGEVRSLPMALIR